MVGRTPPIGGASLPAARRQNQPSFDEETAIVDGTPRSCRHTPASNQSDAIDPVRAPNPRSRPRARHQTTRPQPETGVGTSPGRAADRSYRDRRRARKQQRTNHDVPFHPIVRDRTCVGHAPTAPPSRGGLPALLRHQRLHELPRARPARPAWPAARSAGTSAGPTDPSPAARGSPRRARSPAIHPAGHGIRPWPRGPPDRDRRRSTGLASPA